MSDRPAALVLCGGESRRMGRAKAWLPFGSELLLQRVVRLVSQAAAPVVVVAAAGQDLPKLPGDILVCRDEVAGRGPLQGLVTGLAAFDASVELVFACGTDSPLLKPAWIARLVELIGDFDLAIPEVNGMRHPLAALYRRSVVLQAAERHLQANRLALLDLVAAVRSRIVTGDELREIDPELETLRNVNTLEEYRAALSDEGFSAP